MKTKFIFYFISILVLVCSKTNSHGQGYIHLKGKQFIDENGQPFYPMVMNYLVDFVYTGAAPAADFSNCHIAQASVYGLDGVHDYSDVLDGPNRILQDFYEMKNMGFNTVRLVMTPKKILGEGFYLDIKNFPAAQTYFQLQILPPYDRSSNAALRFYQDCLMQVISIAASADMKVMLICADPGNPAYGGGQLVSGNAGDLNIEDYAVYLGKLAEYLNYANIHNLFAYEFHGEPTLAEGRLSTRHSKTEICEIANHWNSQTKQFDPNHLTTVGSFFLDDPFEGGWDADLINVDFTNLHLYLTPQSYSFDPGNSAAYWQEEYKRYRDKFYVFSESVKKPFIIGETSFPGRNPGSNPNLVFPIATYGDEAEQFNFVEQTFPIIRNYGASGYGWWNFQNYHWYGDPNPSLPQTGPFPFTLQNYQEQYLGLLNYGNPDPLDLLNGYQNANSQLRKLAAAKFVYYKNNPPSIPSSVDIGPVSQIVDMSELYYNPYSHSVNSSNWTDDNGVTFYGTVKGNVKDQNGRPICRAIIKGTSLVGVVNNKVVDYPYYTFSDVNGDFEIRNYDFMPLIDADVNRPGRDKVVSDIKVAYFGSEWKELGWAGGNFDPIFNFIELNSLQSQFDVVLDNITVPISSMQNFHGLSTLSANNVIIEGNDIIGGSSELKSSLEVNLKSGFNAQSGCEVHVFNESIDVYCEEINSLGFRRANSNVALKDQDGAFAKEQEIEINFLPNQSHVSATIYPNPNNGNFVVNFLGNVKRKSPSTIRIFDSLGNEVMRDKFEGVQYKASLTNLLPGFYFIYTNSDGNSLFLKFIIM